ncbi:helix-turn-helix domain-containing protein [Nocardiopsis sp. ARC36]
MSLGDRIRTARQRARLTQEQLAERVGVGRRTIDNWENGRTLPKNVVALEDVLGSLAGEASAPTEESAQASTPEGGRFATEERRSRLTGRVWRIVTDLEADTEGIPPEEADAMIERAMANAEAQARLMLDAELRRRERYRNQGEAAPVEDQT